MAAVLERVLSSRTSLEMAEEQTNSVVFCRSGYLLRSFQMFQAVQDPCQGEVESLDYRETFNKLLQIEKFVVTQCLN